jgi:bile acid:Na+ symporter, BASS family
MSAKEIIILALVASVLLSVLGYGLKATISEAFCLFRRPGQLFRTLLSMNVVMPLFAILLVLLFDFDPLIRAVLVALAISPVPPLFPSSLSKAEEGEAYAIGLLVGASLSAILLIPLTLGILQTLEHKPLHISTPEIIVSVLITVIIPLILGIAIRHFAPAFATRVAGKVIRSGQILLLLVALPLLFILFPSIMHLISSGTVLAFIAFVVVGVLAGHLLGGPSPKDRTILAIATSTRHPGIAIAIANANLPEHDLVPAAVVLYLLISILVTIPYMKWLAHEKPAAVLTEAPR